MGVEVVEREARVGHVLAQPVDDRGVDVDADVAADGTRGVEQRLDDLGAAADVEDRETAEIVPAHRPAEQIDGGPPRIDPLLAPVVVPALQLRRNGQTRLC